MEMNIQDPIYADSMRFGEALIDACSKGIDGAGAFAFAEQNGIDLFLGDKEFGKYIRTNNYVLIVGTDSITDYKAITKLRDYNSKYPKLSIYCYIHDSRKYLFHPKITWFQTSTGDISLIGSGNLTERGLFHNVEIYSYDELDKKEFDEMKDTWLEWLNYSISSNLIFTIDDRIVDHAIKLSSQKKAMSFTSSGSNQSKKTQISTELTELYKKQPALLTVKKRKTTSTPTTPVTLPPKSSTIISQKISKVSNSPTPSVVNPVWTINLADRILVVEITKSGSRWSQINFDKKSFTEFFGATPGGKSGTYRILLKHTNALGKLMETESRPSVSVASHNWRFEISAASGLAYPQGSDRPYVVFDEVSTRSFIYELIMPGDPGYTDINAFVKAWKNANNKTGIARIITDGNTLNASTPSLGLWKV